MNPNKNVYYFAYGSNMLTSRFHDRIPNALPIGEFKLCNFVFLCNKKSKDGSGKGNIEFRDEEVVWGEVYEISTNDLNALDKIEWGYERKIVEIENVSKALEAITYISKILTDEPPYDWYMKTIIDGAKEYSLPTSYIGFLEGIETKHDLRQEE